MPDATPAAPLPDAGWFPDPDEPGLLRYWTGSRWTDDRTPAVQPPSASAPAAAPVMITFGKTTTAGVLLWLFLGSLGAHRHYVGKHLSAVLQPLVYGVGAALIAIGLNMQNPGGIGPNTTLASVGVFVAATVGLWVVIDVLFIAGWVREWNRTHGGTTVSAP